MFKVAYSTVYLETVELNIRYINYSLFITATFNMLGSVNKLRDVYITLISYVLLRFTVSGNI